MTCRCNYPAGIISEHKWTRSSASLFDVSHMGQIIVRGEKRDRMLMPARALERLIPGDICWDWRRDGRPMVCLVTEEGGILDDLMVSNWGRPLSCWWSTRRERKPTSAHIAEVAGHIMRGRASQRTGRQPHFRGRLRKRR